jgi:hypothetical protein
MHYFKNKTIKHIQENLNKITTHGCVTANSNLNGSIFLPNELRMKPNCKIENIKKSLSMKIYKIIF